MHAQKCIISQNNSKIFWGWGTAPSLDPTHRHLRHINCAPSAQPDAFGSWSRHLGGLSPPPPSKNTGYVPGLKYKLVTYKLHQKFIMLVWALCLSLHCALNHVYICILVVLSCVAPYSANYVVVITVCQWLLKEIWLLLLFHHILIAYLHYLVKSQHSDITMLNDSLCSS